jgi:hypothetical protein
MLMQLQQPEWLGMFHGHERRIRCDVYPDFDDYAGISSRQMLSFSQPLLETHLRDSFHYLLL